MNTSEKLYRYLVKNHGKKPADINIWQYNENPNKTPPFIRSEKHNSTFLNAQELWSQGLIDIQIHNNGNRAFLKLRTPQEVFMYECFCKVQEAIKIKKKLDVIFTEFALDKKNKRKQKSC
jgi:hypothetical protein